MSRPRNSRSCSTGTAAAELRCSSCSLPPLGASKLTYEATETTRQLADWGDVHVHMVDYFGGVSALWSPDQLRSAFTCPCR